MVTHIISNECIVFYLHSDEEFALREAVNKACKSTGFKTWDDIEAELFNLGKDSLIIVRPRPPLTRRVKDGIPRLYRI